MIASDYFKEIIVPLKILDHCKWPPEIMTVTLKCMTVSGPLKSQYVLNRNICQIHCVYTTHGCNCCSKIKTVSINEWMAATNFVK